MDNDRKIVKIIKSTIKNVRFRMEYFDKHIPSEEAGNQEIFNLVKVGKPAAVMRLGSTETNCAYPWMIGKEPDQATLERGLYSAGIFPAEAEHNAAFSKIYLEAARSADFMALCGVFKEKKIVDAYCTNAKFIRSRSIEPYYFNTPWTKALEGKNILIVHPFVETINKQYQRRESIFVNPDILPEFGSIQFVKTVQSAAGAKTEFNTWSEALQFMCDEITRKEFDIAIVGAGAYAMPICAHIKGIGKIAIQMSGATQLLFGIKGKRWDDHPVISKFYNDAWVRPLQSETPPEIKKVEGGSYW